MHKLAHLQRQACAVSKSQTTRNTENLLIAYCVAAHTSICCQSEAVSVVLFGLFRADGFTDQPRALQSFSAVSPHTKRCSGLLCLVARGHRCSDPLTRLYIPYDPSCICLIDESVAVMITQVLRGQTADPRGSGQTCCW